MSKLIKLKKFLTPAGLIILGVLIGWFINRQFDQPSINEFYKIHPSGETYKYVNPLLGFEVSGVQTGFKDLEGLKNQISSFVDETKSAHKATGVSVYYRNMDNAHWLGINENDQYDPGSLYKVPFMIAYFQEAQSDQSVLSKKLYYDGSYNEPNSVQTAMLTPGTYYTVDDLIKKMIVSSDNSSKDLLVKNIDLNYIYNVFKQLNLPFVGEDNYLISPQKYSLFFRILYNSTFLNPDMSEKALGLLSQTDFVYGLRQGVPAEINIAHKFGDHVVYQGGSIASYELHDCGIVYQPQKPYFLCVMTRGATIQDLSGVIGGISKIVYEDNNK